MILFDAVDHFVLATLPPGDAILYLSSRISSLVKHVRRGRSPAEIAAIPPGKKWLAVGFDASTPQSKSVRTIRT